MSNLTFLDTEISSTGLIKDIGCINHNNRHFHSGSTNAFNQFIQGTNFICGHNIIHHDLKYIGRHLQEANVSIENSIDTLYLSPLLFPNRPYHNLLKDDKLQIDELNNPLNDAIKARDLFYDEVSAFNGLDEVSKQIYFHLLHDKKEFKAFFQYLSFKADEVDLAKLIRNKFSDKLCINSSLELFVESRSVELAYCLALINATDNYSITPPWVLRNYPEVERIMNLLRNKSCVSACSYCDNKLDVRKGLKKFFGYDSFRSYAGEPLQEKAAQAAMDNKSLLAIFPTGGGKSITFQVPALMSGQNTKGLTVVISPLQSLMKDQVDNLEKNGITEAVTINGLLDPIARAKSIERVEDGSASMLYISPETLRSKTIERLLLGRKIVRFVIDEAHCFSSWGQDFRVDYLYIGDFIKLLQDKKNLKEGIPVSCFTATAKQKVIEDIQDYFKEKLGLELELFTTLASRENLNYKVWEKEDEEAKYVTVRELIEEKNCPTIVYVSRTKKARIIAERLVRDGFNARPFHGKMESQEKTSNQNAFLSGEVQIMVATSAFGMGVDKSDVGLVIHFDISDSLENYIQEAGRAGRDQRLQADCHILFNEEDLSKHFIMLNQTKLSIKEIQQVWKAIKDLTKFRDTTRISNSALEIARKAGWDDTIAEIETRVTTAIAALEDAGYLKRGQNMPKVFANSILSKNAQEAIERINTSERFSEKQKQTGIRIIKKLFSSRSRKRATDEAAEARIDYISDHLGIVKEEVINVVNLLREEKILADTKDLSAYIRKGESKNRSLTVLDTFGKIELFMLTLLDGEEHTFNLKEINEQAEQHGCNDITLSKLKTMLNFWVIKHWIKRHQAEHSNHVTLHLAHPYNLLQEKLSRRHELGNFILNYLFDRSINISSERKDSDEILVEFSVHELKDAYDNNDDLFKRSISIEDVEDTLFFLSRIEAMRIEGGFLVVYNRLTIERLEKDNRILYKTEDYRKLRQHYENKIEQIHVVGEYALKMIQNHKEALQFVDDYFQLNYTSFLNKYFKGNRQEDIKRTITRAKFKQLFGELSVMQLKIVNDHQSKNIVVTAGPGSGKTRVLVHKLASLLLMEDVKHEQLLMLTFSRAAATEFKQRLSALIGNASYYIDIKTFHSFCFDLSGKVGSITKSESIIRNTVEKIKNGEVEPSLITKTVLVIDEAQDMNPDEYALVLALMEQNEEMRIVAVGDDDQTIYEFRHASAEHLEHFIREQQAEKYELIENYRSKHNLVEFSNQFANNIRHRLKETPIYAVNHENGNIRLIHYQSRNLIEPLVTDLLNATLSGSTSVLTRTNEEAFLVAALLQKQKIPVKLIQGNEGFNLYDTWEIRFFYELIDFDKKDTTISDDLWESAKRKLKEQFQTSSKFEICSGLIRTFEQISPKIKYKSDLLTFIRESKPEDFYTLGNNVIFVSTIHKAKGKEFDNVFLLLDNFIPGDDPTRRQLYVGLTRAKQNLTIHLNGNYLDNIQVDHLTRIEDQRMYDTPKELVLNLTHKDVWLDFFIGKDSAVSQYKSGDPIALINGECIGRQGTSLLKFSAKFKLEIEELMKKGYKLKAAKVNFIVYWKKEDTESETKIILPELYFEK